MLITVVVPVYNTEKYLHKCIQNIINQSYPYLEIILVNDGSTDSSKTIIDNYVSKDSRIVSIHKENGGIGSALKLAIEVMTGDYVLFVDSDDWLELDAVETLVKLATENDADMVSFGIRAYNPQGEEAKLPSFKSIDLIETSNEAILKTHFEVLKHPTLVRLWKRELFNNVVIFEQNIGIDEMLTPQLLARCNRAVYTVNIYYNVLLRQNSVSRILYNDKKINETLLVYQFLCDFAEKRIPRYVEYFQIKYLIVLFGLTAQNVCADFTLQKKTSTHLFEEYYQQYLNVKNKKGYIQLKLLLKLKMHLLIKSPRSYNILASSLLYTKTLYK